MQLHSRHCYAAKTNIKIIIPPHINWQIYLYPSFISMYIPFMSPIYKCEAMMKSNKISKRKKKKKKKNRKSRKNCTEKKRKQQYTLTKKVLTHQFLHKRFRWTLSCDSVYNYCHGTRITSKPPKNKNPWDKFRSFSSKEAYYTFLSSISLC